MKYIPGLFFQVEMLTQPVIVYGIQQLVPMWMWRKSNQNYVALGVVAVEALDSNI